MARRYRLKKRAQRQEKTKQRIIQAAIELHEALGPARTTISAIAERAGVERLTVYRHFPTELSLFTACTKHYWSKHPFPDPEPWRFIADPASRLERALHEVYAYHRSTQTMTVSFLRDAPIKPVVVQTTSIYVQHWKHMQDVLALGWKVPRQTRHILLGVIGHALAFQTWYSLACQQGLREEEAIRLMVGMVRNVAPQ